MATFVQQKIGPTGLNPAYSAVSASDRCSTGPSVFLHVKNAGASPDSVVIADTTSVAPSGATSFNASLTVSVPNAGERMIGPITDRYANADGLGATVTHSFLTTVTAGCFVI